MTQRRITASTSPTMRESSPPKLSRTSSSRGAHYMPCSQAYFESCQGHYGLSSQYLLTNGPFTFGSAYAWQTDSGKRSITVSRSDTYRGRFPMARIKW